MIGWIRYIFLLCLVLVGSIGAIAQLSMPDSVIIGATKHYNVYPNPVTGSTYIWTIDGVTQKRSATHEIDITWSTAGVFLLEVQELSVSGCLGPLRSGRVVVNAALYNAYTLDLGVVNTVDNPNVLIGHNAVFTITATDYGPYNATEVTVTNLILHGYTYVSNTTTTGNYNCISGIWTIGNLKNGTSESLTLTATVNATGSYDNTATITGNEKDGNLANNVSQTITSPTDFFIPDGFSPNGDEINDLFVIRGISNYPDNTFIIYNRWGNKVFEARPYQNTWNGKSTFGLSVGGDDLPIGTYFYLLNLGDGSKVIKGTIYLNR
jgi:gliding motility-associated-like protein/uncharacterized repeat protein (TIGR01451 family)